MWSPNTGWCKISVLISYTDESPALVLNIVRVSFSKKDLDDCGSCHTPHWQHWPRIHELKITVHLRPAAAFYLHLSACHCLTLPLTSSLLSLSLSVSLSVSPFFPAPLVRLMDDSTGREWQYINCLVASLILIWLPESSGSAEGRLGYVLTWPGWTHRKKFELKTASILTLHCLLHGMCRT